MKDEGDLRDAVATIWHRFFILQDYRQAGKWIRIAMDRAGLPLCDEHDYDSRCEACRARLDRRKP